MGCQVCEIGDLLREASIYPPRVALTDLSFTVAATDLNYNANPADIQRVWFFRAA